MQQQQADQSEGKASESKTSRTDESFGSQERVQTSAHPPSSSLYDASLSGRSGLSTNFATRSSARPDQHARPQHKVNE